MLLVMKKSLALGLFVSVSLHATYIHDWCSESFMFTRPASMNLALEQSLFHRHMYNKVGNMRGTLQIVPFYERTQSSGDDLHGTKAGAFFLPFGKQILIAGADSGVLCPIDVRAEWLGLPSNFSGNLSFSPEQKQTGVLLEYHQDIGRLHNSHFVEFMWAAISMPIIVVKNNLHARQFNIQNPGTTFPRNILEAFSNPAWHYAKINGEMRKTGVADIKLKLGLAFYHEHNFEVNWYSLLSIPCSGLNNPQFIFSPFVGNNKHWGVGSGVLFQIPLTYNDAPIPVRFFLDLEHIFLIRNKQFRTFDLHGKPWSRYMTFNSRDGKQVNVPGANVLTRFVKARPGSFVDMSTGFRTEFKNIEAEIGYDLWAHAHERVQLLPTYCPDCAEEVPLEEYGITGTATGPGAAYGGFTASSASINTFPSTAGNNAFIGSVASDQNFVGLIPSDIDQSSGTSRPTITHKAHGALGWSRKGEQYETFVGGGAFGEWPQNNAALARWGIWGKAGIGF